MPNVLLTYSEKTLFWENEKKEDVSNPRRIVNSQKSLYSGTGSTVRVCPNFTEERVTMSFVGIHWFVPVREGLWQGNGGKQS